MLNTNESKALFANYNKDIHNLCEYTDRKQTFKSIVSIAKAPLTGREK